MKWGVIASLLGLTLLLCIPALAAGYVVKVDSPGNSGNDTAMLQAALDDCVINHPAGCTVQLSEGTYVTKQLVAVNFHGIIKGMGMDRTSIEAFAPLPVPYPLGWWNYDREFWPMLIHFVDGDISISDLTIKVPAAVATEEWFYDDLGQVPVHELHVVLYAAGASVNLSLNRVKMEGGFADEPTPWGRLNVEYGVLSEPEPWPGSFVGTMSVKGSVFRDVNVAFGADYLGSSRVTIGGSPFTGNLFEDVEIPIILVQLEGSSSEISYNNIIRTNWLGINLNQAPLEPSKTASRFVVKHNNITVVPTYAVDSGWWPDAIDIWDWNWDNPTSVKSEFIVSNNTIQLSHDTAVGIGAAQDLGSIISNNQISGVGWAALWLDGSTQDMLLGNNVGRFTAEETELFGTLAPVWLWDNTSQNTVVGGNNRTNAVDLGTDNTLVGVNNMHGNPPGPAIRDAMKRKMEMIKSMRKP